MLTLSGGLDIAGTAGTAVAQFGGVNATGAGSYVLSGALSGTATLDKNGAGTLLYLPSSVSGFSGTIRLGASVTNTQTTLRITTATSLGTRTSTTTNSVLDFNGGNLEVLQDTPSVLSGGAAANVYHRAGTSSLFVDHAPGSAVISQTLTLGQFAFEESATFNFNGRNGYGITLGASPVQGGTGNSTINSNLVGGGTLTFTGNLWSNSDSTGSRTLTMGGAGNMLVNGALSAVTNAAGFDHSLTKTGAGTLTLANTGATLDGAVNIQQGTLQIADFGAINNSNTNTATLSNFAINIGNSTTGAGLTIGVNGVTPSQLTSNRAINLAGSTGGATITANQSTGAVVLPTMGNIGVGAKTLVLAGTSAADNTISAALADNSGALSLTKTDVGTWVLSGNNTYTGGTTISGGTLKLAATAAASDIIASTAAVTFTNNGTTATAGGTLEFVGQAGVTNVESLGALTPTAGAGVVKLSPGLGGTASLTFSSLGTVAGASATNFITSNPATNIVTLSGQAVTNATTLPGSGKLYLNGSDFATINASAQVVAPVYTSGGALFNDAGAALTASRHNRITGTITGQPAVTVSSLKMDGATTSLTTTGNLIISTGGLLVTGGSATISGTGISTSAQGLSVRTNLSTDTLTLNAPILSSITVGLMKNGAGTLVLAGANAQTGATTILEGTVKLSGSGTLSGLGQDLTIRQAGTFDMNGVSTGGTIRNLVGSGTVINSGAAATLTLGNSNTATGLFTGTIQGGISVRKTGSFAQTLAGNSTYTGSTTIDQGGNLIVNTLADIGQPSGLGAGTATNDASNAASLVFQSSVGSISASLQYAGTSAVSTNRLFTLDQNNSTSTASILNNSSTNAPMVFSKTSAIAFGPNATVGQTLILSGSSTGDSVFNPQLADNGALATRLIKSGTGNWTLGNTNNTYTGQTRIDSGTLVAKDGTSLPTASNLNFNGGVLETSGSFTRTLGTGAGQMQFGAIGGFAASVSKLTVDWGSTPSWNSTPNFIQGNLTLGSSTALSEVVLASGFNLTQGSSASPTVSTTNASPTLVITSGDTSALAVGQAITGTNIPAGATITNIVNATQFTISANASATGTGIVTTITGVGGRQVTVNDNTNTGSDFATITGSIGGTGNFIKGGVGILQLFGSNSYVGTTTIGAGALAVTSLGSSTGPVTNTSLGTSSGANTAAQALLIGNGGATGGTLEYVGAGETTDRMIRLNGTGTLQIHADGSGPLVLTNVQNDAVAGVKTLTLRGSNAGANMITSQLTDFSGALSVSVDGGAMWVFPNANTYSGTTTNGVGAVGAGHDQAFGTGTITLSNGSLFAYGGDRTFANPVAQVNGTTTAFIGDYNIAFTSPYVNQSAGTSNTLTNNIVSGKTLTIPSMSNDLISAARNMTFNGGGDTLVGNITTSTSSNLSLVYSGTGSLTLTGGANALNGGGVTVSSGKLVLGVNQAIPDVVNNGAGSIGNVTVSPAAGVTATIDLNGKTETINGLTGTSAGTMVITNSSATAASLTVGANNQTVAWNGTVTRPGGGGITLGKIGTGVATFGGAADITGIDLQGGSLKLNGGITTPSAMTSVSVAGGSLLQLYDFVGTPFANLTTLSLGAGSGTATLELDVGDAGSDSFFTSNAASSTNTILFNIRDVGLTAGATYTLLSAASGLDTGTYQVGAVPGFAGSSLSVDSTFVKLNVGTAVQGSMYWTGTGTTAGAWNSVDGSSNGDNWSSAKLGTPVSSTIPGAGTTVVLQADNAAAGPLNTTLGQSFRINDLVVETATNTPAAITIGPGVVSTNRLTIQPALSTDGINVKTGTTPLTTISAPVGVGSNQTWTVADRVLLTGGTTTTTTVVTVANTAGLRPGMPLVGLGIPSGMTIQSVDTPTQVTLTGNTTAGTGQEYYAYQTLTLSGGLTGSGSITKEGNGRIILSGSGSTYTGSSVTINGGTLELSNLTALGGVSGSPNTGATIAVNSGGTLIYNSGTGATVPNPLTLNGGTLAVGGTNHAFSGNINLAGNSTLTGADQALATTTTARSITLSGTISGAGNLTVNSGITTSAGNTVIGGPTITGNTSGWTGGLTLLRGTVIATHASGVGSGPIAFNQFGRVQWQAPNGSNLSYPNDFTFASNAVGEINIDNNSATATIPYAATFTGAMTINGGSAVRMFATDGANSVMNITGPVTLNGNASISVGGATGAVVTISSVIGEAGGARALSINDDLYGYNTANRTLRLTGLNTFSGPLSVSEGVLEFDTVTNAAGAASALGQGSTITLGASTSLSFIGSTSQSTDRTMTFTGFPTFIANGTSGAIITYNGAINAAGNSLNLDGTGSGVINGVITQTGTVPDVNKNGSGTWTLGASNAIIDDISVNAGTLVLAAVNVHQGDDLIIRNGGTVQLAVNGALSNNAINGMDALTIGDSGTNGSTLDLKGTSGHTVNAFTIGTDNTIDGYVIDTVGGGSIASTGFVVRNGAASATLTGSGTLTKNGAGTFLLSGTNTYTGATSIAEGTLVLDFSTDTGSKVSSVGGMSMGGSANDMNPVLQVNGNASSPAVQNTGTITLNPGSSVINVSGVGGQAMTLAIGSFARNQGGAVDLRITGDGVITTTHTITENGIIGGFATVNNGTAFAVRGAGDVVGALTPTVKNSTASWQFADNVSDSGAFTGTILSSARVNSITYMGSGSSVALSTTGSLGILSGGVLVTSGASTGGISGGFLSSGRGNGDIIVHQYSSSDFTISSTLRRTNSITKVGPGTLVLSGNNTSINPLFVNDGLVKFVGGQAVGDTATVNLKDQAGSGIQLLASETTGTLFGGGITGGNVNLGAFTLTVNQASNQTFGGQFTGTGSFVKNGTSQLNLDVSSSPGFTGSVVVNAGLLNLTGTGVNNFSAITSMTVNAGGAVLIDDNTIVTANRLGDIAAINLAGVGNGSFFTLQMRSNQPVSHTETLGAITLTGGATGIGLQQTSGTTNTLTLAAASLTRQNNATVFIDGTVLANTSASNRSKLTFTTAPALTGGAGVVGGSATNVPILRYAVSIPSALTVAITDIPSTFVTYGANGIQPLNLTNEYKLNTAGYTASADATDNLRFTAGATGLTNKAFNSVVFDSGTATGGMTVDGVATDTLTINSGAMLFTSANAGNATTLSGFAGVSAGASNEFIITVANTTPVINSPLVDGTGATALTKSGSGTLVLGATNTFTGPVNFNQGVIRATTLASLGSGTALNFNGGTLQFNAAFDPSVRTMTFNPGGATIDTGANSMTFANAIGGGGSGGLTKFGTGILTLNGVANYTGDTIVGNGVLSVGSSSVFSAANNIIVSGATFNVPSATATIGSLSMSAGTLTGNGTINATSYNFTGGSMPNSLILSGNGGLTKNGTTTFTLAGAHTFTGPVSVLQGTLSFDSIADLGVPSALGAPTTPENGTIQLGLGGNTVALTYTGTGHSTNRLIDYAKTSGSSTAINANGTGPLTLGGGIISSEEGGTGGTKVLVLSGTSDPSIINRITAPIVEVLGNLKIVKNDINTWELAAASSFSTLAVDQGKLIVSAPQNIAGSLFFGNTIPITTTGTMVLNADVTATTFGVNTDSTSANTLTIAAGKTLTINGAWYVGSSQTGSSTSLLNANGGGDMVVNNPTSGSYFQVGNGIQTASPKVITDLSGLNSLTVNISPVNGVFRVGSTSVTNLADKYSLLTLPSTGSGTTTVTAHQLAIGDFGQRSGVADPANTLRLGSGVNTFNVNVINIGTGQRDIGVMGFNNSSGSLIVRNAAGTGRTIFNMGTTNGGTGISGAGNSFNVNGHNADLLFSAVTIDTQNRGGALGSVFSFDQGTLDMSNLTMTTRSADQANGAGNPRTTSTIVNLGGGTVNIQNGILAMASQSGSYGTNPAPVMTATINITGGNVTIGATSGTAITMASTTSTGGTGTATSTATINLTGGNVTVNGDIVRGTVSGTGTATGTVVLNGVTLDMAGHAVGATGAPITLDAQSGTLKNLGDLNGGAALTKTGSGMLILDGTNTFTSDLLINAGTVRVDSATGLGSTAGITTVADGASLHLNNVNVGNESITINGSGVAGAGALIATGSATMGAPLVLASASVIGVPSALDTLYLNGNISGSAGYTKVGAGTIIVSGNGSNYSGTTTVTQGTMRITDPSALGNASSGTVVAPGAILELGGGITIGAEDLTLNSTGAGSQGTLRSGDGTNNFGGNISFGGTHGTISAAPGSTLNLTGANVAKTNAILTLSGGGVININNVITGDGNGAEFNDDLVVDNTTVQLNAQNTYTGPTSVINGGTLRNGITDALPNSATVGSGGSTTLTLGHASDGAVTNTYSLNGFNQTIATLSSVSAGGNTNTVVNGSATTDSTLSVSSGSFGGLIADGSTGKLALVKQGAGSDTLTLSAANTFTGGTTVNSGTLNATNTSGSATGTGNVTVSPGATLAGTGHVITDSGKAVTINGALLIGDATQSLPTVSQLEVSATNIAFGIASLSSFDLFSGAGGGDNTMIPTAADLLKLSGNLTIASGATLVLGNPNALSTWAIGDTWKLIDTTGLGSVTGTFALDWSALGLGVGLSVDSSSLLSSGVISIIAVPEPGRAALLMFGLGGLLLRRRRIGASVA